MFFTVDALLVVVIVSISPKYSVFSFSRTKPLDDAVNTEVSVVLVKIRGIVQFRVLRYEFRAFRNS